MIEWKSSPSSSEEELKDTTVSSQWKQSSQRMWATPPPRLCGHAQPVLQEHGVYVTPPESGNPEKVRALDKEASEERDLMEQDRANNLNVFQTNFKAYGSHPGRSIMAKIKFVAMGILVCLPYVNAMDDVAAEDAPPIEVYCPNCNREPPSARRITDLIEAETMADTPHQNFTISECMHCKMYNRSTQRLSTWMCTSSGCQLQFCEFCFVGLAIANGTTSEQLGFPPGHVAITDLEEFAVWTRALERLRFQYPCDESGQQMTTRGGFNGYLTWINPALDHEETETQEETENKSFLEMLRCCCEWKCADPIYFPELENDENILGFKFNDGNEKDLVYNPTDEVIATEMQLKSCSKSDVVTGENEESLSLGPANGVIKSRDIQVQVEVAKSTDEDDKSPVYDPADRDPTENLL